MLNSTRTSILLFIYVISFCEASDYRYDARFSRGKDVRFGYQNPIRVAPTLPPFAGMENKYEQAGNNFVPVTSPTPGPTWPPPSTGNEPNYEQAGDNFGPVTFETSRPTFPTFSGCSTQVDRYGQIIHSRIDKGSQKCVQLGSSESCGKGKNMAFYGLSNDEIYGECDCTRTSKRPLVYHKNTDTCYFIYQQAYCPPEQWLVLENGKPTCQDNPCRRYGTTELQWDWTENSDVLKMNTRGIVPIVEQMQCVPLGSTCERDGSFKVPGARSPSSQIPEVVTVLRFRVGDLSPGCHPILDQEVPSTSNPDEALSGQECRPGSKLNVLGRC